MFFFSATKLWLSGSLNKTKDDTCYIGPQLATQHTAFLSCWLFQERGLTWRKPSAGYEVAWHDHTAEYGHSPLDAEKPYQMDFQEMQHVIKKGTTVE